nr:MAG TPA_asm: dsDNA helicase [Caudoviricetes sp.]
MALQLHTREKLAEAARTISESFALVNHKERLYVPIDYLTKESSPQPDEANKVWQLLKSEDLVRFANMYGNILFANDSEKRNFEGMLLQLATQKPDDATFIFIATEAGLKQLHADGSLKDPDGTFSPNFITTKVNSNPDDVQFVKNTITEWVGSDEQATSLLHHLASALAVTWSAVRYVLLLGEGSNGKGVLLTMVTTLFDPVNISGVTRQLMADSSPACLDVNNMLLNIVMDGPATYLGDSGLEKTLVAGEPAYLRPLYSGTLMKAQTNALFIEGLNKEPKTRDKSKGLQRRLIRFWFNNEYAQDLRFSRKMRSPRYLGAFLQLLLDHFVTEDTMPELLKPTKEATDLRVDQMLVNSMGLQFLLDLHQKNPKQIDKLIDSDIAALVGAFNPWVLSQTGDHYSDLEARKMLGDLFHTRRSSRRVNGAPQSYYKITGFKTETQQLLEQLKGGENVSMVVDEE